VKVKRPEIQEKLKTLKPGDEVQITYTEAMAITVERKEP
jgi:translation elongation factor P/translation initiation factor 5A